MSITKIRTRQVSISTVTKTTDYTVTLADDIILCDTSASNVTITLPSAVGITKTFILKKISPSNTLIILPSLSETIDNSTSATLTVDMTALTFVSNNVNWFII